MLPPRPIPEPDLAIVVCDVGALEADLAAVELLARLRLEARRLGCGLRLRGVSRELEQMVAFCGLSDVVPVEEDAGGGLLGGGNGGQAEEREYPRGVEERVDAGDPPI